MSTQRRNRNRRRTGGGRRARQRVKISPRNAPARSRNSSKPTPSTTANQFAKIGSDAKFVWTFNLWAGLFGPIWFSARGMWNWGLTFLILETLAAVQIIRGLFGDLASEAWERIAKIEGTLELSRQQLQSAIENNTDKIDVYRANGGVAGRGDWRYPARSAAARGNRSDHRHHRHRRADRDQGGRQAIIANTLLEKRFSDWLSDPGISPGMTTLRTSRWRCSSCTRC